MLPEAFPLLEPLEYPPPDPPLALAKETAGVPIRAITMNEAISFVWFKAGSLFIDGMDESHAQAILPAMGLRRWNIRKGRGRQLGWSLCSQSPHDEAVVA